MVLCCCEGEGPEYALGWGGYSEGDERVGCADGELCPGTELKEKGRERGRANQYVSKRDFFMDRCKW